MTPGSIDSPSPLSARFHAATASSRWPIGPEHVAEVILDDGVGRRLLGGAAQERLGLVGLLLS